MGKPPQLRNWQAYNSTTWITESRWMSLASPPTPCLWPGTPSGSHTVSGCYVPSVFSRAHPRTQKRTPQKRTRERYPENAGGLQGSEPRRRISARPKNKQKRPNHLQRGRKDTGQNPTQFTLKTFHKPEANFLSPVQGTYKKHTANIILKVEDCGLSR